MIQGEDSARAFVAGLADREAMVRLELLASELIGENRR